MVTQASGTVFIYNVAGQLVKTSTANKGLSKVDVPTTGIYIVKLISGNNTVVKKVWIQ